MSKHAPRPHQRRLATAVGAALLGTVALGTSVAEALPGPLADGLVSAQYAATQAASPVVLPVEWQQQTKGYNCGPAATRIALSALVRRDRLPSQQQLGVDEGTSPDTGTYRTGMAAGLNKYTPSVRWEPSTGDIWTGVTAAINKKRPLPIAIEIGSRSELPPGWSAGKVGVQHWFTAIGYNPATHEVKVADPASKFSGFNSNPEYWISLTTLRAIHVAHIRPTA
ncbi:C39 family peptidase [Amycolatopsis thailandensis]|uniref:C39 family peptidase n=1 Tax=Amycolatopsis thailandensis TaxID=589330 RepID=UPI00364E3489